MTCAVVDLSSFSASTEEGEYKGAKTNQKHDLNIGRTQTLKLEAVCNFGHC